MFVGHREVYKVEVYARVRRAVQVDGMSIRQACPCRKLRQYVESITYPNSRRTLNTETRGLNPVRLTVALTVVHAFRNLLIHLELYFLRSTTQPRTAYP